MSKHSKIGEQGELIASDFLEKKGYKLLFRNWRAGKKEIDLIMLEGDTAIFVEVKTRNSTRLAFPEEFVTSAKKHNFKVASEYFLAEFQNIKWVRFDIIGIVLVNGGIEEVVHFEDAF